MRMCSTARLVFAAAIVAATASCGDVIRQGQSPVVLVMNSLAGAQGNKPTTFGNPLSSDVITNVISPAPCSATSPCPTIFNDIGQVILSLSPKDLTITPTANNQVTITRYHIDYIRTDGRTTQGVDVPYSVDGASTGTVPSGGTLTLAFELVQTVAKQQAPLIQLVSNPAIINTIARV